MHALRRIRHIVRDHGALGLARFARKAVWQRLPLRPVTMPIGPGHLQIEVSGKCNLKCPMCPRTFSTSGLVNMSFETYRGLLLSVPGLFSVNLQGFGEPLLNRDLERMVRFTRERGIEVGFVTNGTLLSEKRAATLLDAGVQWINVSIDGATRETYERIRVGASFDRVLENVRSLVRLNAARGGGARLALAFVCLRSNLAEAEAFVELTQSLGVPVAFLAPVLDLTDEVPAERLDPEDRAVLDRAKARGEELGIEVGIGVAGERFEPGELPCDWPWNKMYITAEGRATPCCIENEESLGDAAADGVVQVWNGALYRQLREGLVTGKPHAICRKHCFTGYVREGAAASVREEVALAPAAAEKR